MRCIHRHTIDEHPFCFLSGRVKYPRDYDSEKDFTKSTQLPWWSYPDYKVGYIDIESDGFDASFGNVLCWAIYDKSEGKVYSDVITKEDIEENPEKPDKRIVESLINKMREYKILIGYYSTKFDIPFIRTRALHCGLRFPNFGEIYHFDVYYLVKTKLKLSRNTLENACAVMGIRGKNHVDMSKWRKARYGDEKALNYVLDHCRRDVEILDKLHNKLIGFTKHTKKSI